MTLEVRGLHCCLSQFDSQNFILMNRKEKKEKKNKISVLFSGKEIFYSLNADSRHFHVELRTFTRPAEFLALGHNSMWNYFKGLLLLVYFQWILAWLSQLHFDSWKCGIFVFNSWSFRLESQNDYCFNREVIGDSRNLASKIQIWSFSA